MGIGKEKGVKILSKAGEEMSIFIKELSLSDIDERILDHFNRYQEVKMVWRVENNQKVKKDNPFIEEWSNKDKQAIIQSFIKNIKDNGSVFGAFHENRLIGFASLAAEFIGYKKEYLNLMELHVSIDYRGKGLGRKLFQSCITHARKIGAGKLYISAHSSVETIYFYTKIGCVDAQWLWKEQLEREPYDCQMEYIL